MLSPAPLTLMVALLAAAAGADREGKIRVNKCCGELEMLSADGRSCVEAPWPRNFSFQWQYGIIVPPLDSEWVRRWFPPGLPLQDISNVYSGKLLEDGIVSTVNASSLWSEALQQNTDYWRTSIVFHESSSIARPGPRGRLREARYCVDAALPPLGPFAMQFKNWCSDGECAYKCCASGKLMKNDKGLWKCENDAEGSWTPNKSSLAEGFDPEFPFRLYQFEEPLYLWSNAEQQVEWAREAGGLIQFHFSTWAICLDFHRRDGGLVEGLFFHEYPRITRGVYWLLRPLCALSALLLLAPLLSIACDKSMRRKLHGRCLGNHAACLLAFNIGQIGYYIAISDRLDASGKEVLPHDLRIPCRNLALTMYFLLTASWFWLTALCANMAMGFRLHTTSFNKGSGKKFLAISALAWGLPAMLTTSCSILFTHPNWWTPAWYVPSLMETRVCYNEHLIISAYDLKTAAYRKSGTALFYYGPLCLLVACNVTCLSLTLRKVQFLKRGNSVLRRQEVQVPASQRHPEGSNPPSSHTATGSENRNRGGSSVDAKTIKLYIKMILMSGGIELLSEVTMWATTHNNVSDTAIFLDEVPSNIYPRRDRDLAYRAAGYVTDFFRAAVVTWLAAPEGGYLGLLKRLRRDPKEKTSGATEWHTLSRSR